MTRAEFMEYVDPVICTHFDGIYEEAETEYDQVFKESAGEKRRYQEFTDAFGLGLPEEIGENDVIPYDAGGIAFRYRIKFRQWGIAFAVSKLLMEDGEAEDVSQLMTEHAGISMREQKELQHAQYLLGAGDSTISKLGDGQPLLSATRPRVGNKTWSNQVSGNPVLSETAIETIYTQMKTSVNQRGHLSPFKGKKLVVSPANEIVAWKIRNSMLNTGTAGSNVANFSRTVIPDVVVVSRMYQSPIWGFITDCPRGLVTKYRGKRTPARGSEADFNTGAVRIKFTHRYGYGCVDAHGFFGSLGNGS